MRTNNRAYNELRPFSIERNFQPQADASILMKMGNTHVLCAVTIEDSVPPFLRDSGTGWITAEYGMLPCSTNSRMRREAAKGRSGRTYEIQRLIGRSLRMMIDLSQLGEKTLRVDCDVLNADGGTRTASITGAALALRDALTKMQTNGDLAKMPDILPLAAVSVGIVKGEPCLDLDYLEDSSAEADANFILTADGRWVEAQSTAEGKPFTRNEFNQLADLAEKGIKELLELWEAK
ncbi:MAG: ribonuclease PH [Desulfobulbaceae bacterium]|nr:ribonuclease PH [Desulfobulbaceae bacterium]